MIVRAIVRDLGALTVAGALVILVIALAGVLAALVLLLVVIPLLLWLVAAVSALSRLLDTADQPAPEIQELAARRALRVQRTVHAEPASVVDIFSREPVA